MNTKTRIIGLMSGTSLDGLDICCVDFWKSKDTVLHEMICTKSVSYPNDFQKRLKQAINFDAAELRSLSLEFARLMSREVILFISEYALKGTIDCVASHGHTVFHKPEKGITVQLGDGALMADLLNLMVINDFRIGDVKLGGQGAPLVPIGDRLLFSDYQACLNLGGISNISFERKGERIAFDISPANIPLNYLMMDELGLNYDENGDLARSGEIIPALLKDLNQLAFYRKKPPKSLGIEWMESDLFPVLQKYKEHELANRLATIIRHESIQIAKVLNENKIKNVLVTGGGVFNSFLIEQLSIYSDSLVEIPEIKIINFKEALIFALLGYLKMNDEINVLSSVTGALKDSCAGIYHSPSIKS
jgi:anhydro-N-acetylmuramic acid kinase